MQNKDDDFDEEAYQERRVSVLSLWAAHESFPAVQLRVCDPRQPVRFLQDRDAA